MDRRQFLALGTLGATAGIVGCVDGRSGEQSRQVTVAEVFDNRHTESGLVFDAESVATTLDSEHLPTVEVTLSNTGERTVEALGWSTTTLETVSDPKGLKTISERMGEVFQENPPEQVHAEGCLTTEAVILDAIERGETLDPGEARTDLTYVVGDHDAVDNGCIDAGEYTMTQSYTVREVKDGEEPEHMGTFEWGVRFLVEA